MPYCEFYGLAGQHLGASVQRVQRMCADRDVARWQSFLEQLELIRHGPRIGSTFDAEPFQVQREPLANIERHTNQPAFSRDAPPEPDAPALNWLLTELTLLTAEIRLEGGDDRFNWTFADGLGIEEKYTSDAEQAEFRLFVERLFLANQPIDPPFAYLANPDAYSAFLTNVEVGDLLGVEAETGLLGRVSADLRASSERMSHILGAEIDRIVHFLHVVHLGPLDLYYRVYRT